MNSIYNMYMRVLSLLQFISLSGDRYLGGGATDFREILHDSRPMSRACLLSGVDFS